MMVSYYREYQVTLRGRTLVMQYSKHQHLELHSENSSIGNAIQNANCIVQQDLSGANSGMPTTVLRVVVDNIMGQQINHTILHKIFYRYGKILRIVTYLKNNQYHGLVEFGNHIHAFVAMLHLNGQNIYTGCCSLRVQFSKNRGPLEVRQESDKCRDYLNNPLTEEELMSLRRPTAGSERHHSNNPGHVSSNFQNSVVPNMAHQGIHLPVGMIAPPNTSNMGINELTAQLAALAQQSGLALTPAAVAATASFMALTSQNSGPGSQSMSGTPNLSTILAALQGGAVQTGVLPHMSGGNTSVMGSVQTPVSSHVTPVGVRPPPNNNGSTVLIVSNLNEDFLNGQRLWDKPMKIAVSRHNIVQLPKEDTENGLTKDYTNSLLHRFRKPNSKNFQNIYPPSHVLHLSNIPPSVTENDIRVLFATKGFEVTGFRFMKDNKMALVQLETVDLAIQSLIELHNSQLTENSHLRISFSKSAV
uniref:Polypyrimidine tract-binding protein 2 n=1 Tax=Schistosoma haematobium TaxID=6185 RepID=A0A094ZGW6_SCHHA